MSWRRLMSLDELWEDELVKRSVDDTAVILVRFGDDVHCYDDRCPHQASSLGDGELDAEECLLVCPSHQWEFSAKTGASVNPSGHALVRYPIRIVDGVIEVLLEEERR